MFILFGWEKTFTQVESVIKTNCYHCNNDAVWAISKETEWVSLFFVNVLPFINKYHIGCEICGDSVLLRTSFAKKILNPKNRNKKRHRKLVSLIENYQLAGLTETQVKWKKSKSNEKNSKF